MLYTYIFLSKGLPITKQLIPQPSWASCEIVVEIVVRIRTKEGRGSSSLSQLRLSEERLVSTYNIASGYYIGNQLTYS